jgi:serine/threonine protein kinase
LHHTNIVELLNGGRDAVTGEPYFVFEWVESNLASELGARPCTGWDDFARRFGLPILEGLAHAHDRQVEHRDIKPSNILVTEEGIPKISDFGIAKITSDIQPGLTLADHATRPYVPPRGELSPSRDVYAYAVMVLTVLADSRWAANRNAAVDEALDSSSARSSYRASRCLGSFQCYEQPVLVPQSLHV